MKLFLAIVAMTVVIQLSSAVSLHRFKRSPGFIGGFEHMFDLGKRALRVGETVFKQTIPKIPNTEEYQVYRREFESYLNDAKEYHSKEGSCYGKTFDLLTKLAKLWKKYEKQNVADEVKSVKTLLDNSGGNELARVLSEWEKTYDDIDFRTESKFLGDSERTEMQQIVQNVC